MVADQLADALPMARVAKRFTVGPQVAECFATTHAADCGAASAHIPQARFLRGFQQLAAAALQPAVACRVFPKEFSRFSRRIQRWEALSFR